MNLSILQDRSFSEGKFLLYTIVMKTEVLFTALIENLLVTHIRRKS